MMTMLAMVLALAPARGAEKTATELRAAAEEYIHVQAFVEAGEVYLELARRQDVRQRDELFNAHANFDSAFLASGDARLLCRALRLAERVVAEGVFDDAEQAKFWTEIVDEDLSRLSATALKKREPNCRFDAAGRRVAQVPLLAAGEPPRVPVEKMGPTTKANPARSPIPAMSERDARRARAFTAAGATLAGLGLTFSGFTIGALVKHGQELAGLRELSERAANGGLSDSEVAFAYRLRADALDTRALAIGFGAAAVATLVPGAALLATRPRPRRSGVALVPYGGPRGAGAVLRLNF